MKFAQFQRLSKQKFKRRTGMSHQAFYVIVNEVKSQEKNKKKPGRTCNLSVEEQVERDYSILERISTLFSNCS